MQLAVPNALLWLLLAVPILGLYLLKLRLRREPISSTMFWDQVFDDHKPRAIWQRLRQIVSLLLQLLFLTLLALALANPLFTSQLEQARRIVVVVDNSASMSATDVSPSRFDWARRQAGRLIKELREGDQMAIVSTANAAVENGLTDHRRGLQNSLEKLNSTDAPAQIDQALRVARRLVTNHENGKIILLTDQQVVFDETEQLVELRTCGGSVANQGITQLQVRRNLDDLVGFQVLVEVGNFADEPASLRLEINLEDQLLDVVPLEFNADEVRTLVLDYASAEGGKLVARLDQNDSLACDNQAFAVVAPRPVQPVILVTPGSLFLESVLSVIPQLDVSITSDLPDEIPESTILILHRTRFGRVPSGNVFVIDPIADSDWWELQGDIADPVVASQDSKSPLMTHVRLENVVFPDARKLRFTTNYQTLAESLDGSPLYLASQSNSTRLLLLTTELMRGDLPLRTAFPILMSNAIAWFQDGNADLRSAIATGRTAQITLPELAADGDGNWQIKDPQGETRPVGAGEVVVGPLEQVGFYQLAPAESQRTTTASESITLACNLANQTESDIRTVTNASDWSELGGWGHYPVWFFLTLAALLLSAIEWYLYQRRWVG
ncbi:MAG: VWA domain-containing protein [Planctomycetaceae bacterium]|nr:VWA domain-containing protein [Planctomycetaceae bacterium]